MVEYRKIDFDGWSLRVDTGELSRNGQSLRLQEQPLQVLLELVARPGELITREQLISRLWPKGVVDFDAGLNSAVRKLRIALQDDSDSPRYIETVPRKGYRFIGTLSPASSGDSSESADAPRSISTSDAASPLAPRLHVPAWRRLRTYSYLLVGAAVLIVAGTAIHSWREVSGTQPRSTSAGASATLNTLAVLPLGATPSDERTVSQADGITSLLRERLSGLRGLIVTPSVSSELVRGTDVVSIGRQLHARYLVRGAVANADDRQQLEVELIDAVSGTKRWSKAFAQPATASATIREEVAGAIASELQIASDATRSDTRAIDLQAYEIYARAERLLSTQRVDDAEEAAQLFARATELDPQLARAYAGIAEALLLISDITRIRSPDIMSRADKALARALALDPTLGEAWIHRARLVSDLNEVEAHYRRGLELAPGYGPGYATFARFLADRQRRGEASEIVDRGRELDPLCMPLYQIKAVMLIFSRNDVAGHDALLREALTINPHSPPVLFSLTASRYFWTGEMAEGLQLAEQLFALQPESNDARQLLVALYLDMGDAGAAAAVVRDSQSPSVSQMELAQYWRDPQRAAALASELPIAPRDSVSPVAEAIRDGAMLTGDYAPAIKRLEAAHRGWTRAPITNRSTALVYAHALLLGGEQQRGRELAASILTLLDAEGAGRPQGWFSRERAAALALLGENDRALEELALSVKLRRLQRWWYTAERDPLFAAIRSGPRFASIRDEGMKHLAAQRTHLDELRRTGEVLSRTLEANGRR